LARHAERLIAAAARRRIGFMDIFGSIPMEG